GTSGRPKGAVLTHGALAWSAAASAARLGVSADDTWLVPLPLFHVGGLAVLVRSALYGTEVLLVEGFEPADVADHLVSGQATLASLVPTMLSRVLDVWDDEEQVLGRTVRACRQIRAVLLGGGPIAPTLLGRAARHGVPIALTYGLTEAASQVATAQPTTSPRLADGLPPLPYTEVAIRDEHGRSAPIGAVGEIVVKAPGNFSGYWHGAAEGGTGVQLDAAVGGTGARLDAAGWLHTGDGGYLDERGNLHVVGRRADLIVTGGENVYPAEVEAAIERHPGVTECCVVGLPDDEWGSRVVAAVVSGPGRGVSDRELELTAREVLAGYKVPRAFVRWGDRLPRNAAGKLRRSAVRDELEWRRASEAAAEAPPASVDFERAWLERLARCLEEHGDDELRERVLQGSEGLTDESSRREVIEWTRKAMERLTALTDPRTSHDVMSGCACQYPVSQLRDARRAYKEWGDVAAAVAVLQAQFEDFLTNQLGLSESLVRRVVDLGWGLAGRLEGKTVFATKIPKSGSLEEYLAEPDPEKRRALYCHCPRVRDAVAMGEDLPLTYCLCGAGFYRGIWEEILQRPVRVEVVRSVLSGDDVCTVAVHLD
ncbi:MAG: AMP-binding protein, partial [Anaerolineae bacterium]